MRWSVFVSAMLAALSPASAPADGLAPSMLPPRSVGRAGATTVSGDTATLLTNPGGMVRRGAPRLLLSTQILDLDQSFISQRASSPAVRSQTPNQTLPAFAYHHGVGPWVFGIQTSRTELAYSYPTPAFGQPTDDVTRLFPYRYGGSHLRLAERTHAIGAAIRVGAWLGLGASATVTQLEYEERRTIWAGFAGRDALLDPSQDLALSTELEDAFVPGATFGSLIAPPELPIELAVSVEWRSGPSPSGSAHLERTQSASFPGPDDASATARLFLPASATVRAGARYLGERFVAELGADYRILRKDQRPNLHFRNLAVVDSSTAEAAIDQVPALISGRRQLVVRGAVDVEVVPGLLWLTGGYAYSAPSSLPKWRGPVFSPLGGHMLALGAEATYEQIVLSIGYSRQLSQRRSLPANSQVQVYDPFDPELGVVVAGDVEQSTDLVGIAAELALD